MKIAINAISIIRGGGLVVLRKLISGFLELAPDHEYHVIANSTLPDFEKTYPQVRVHRFEWAEGNYLKIWFWYVAVLPVWLARQHIDVLFSKTCYLPLIRPCRMVLLVQDAKYFHDSSEFLKNCSITERIKFRLQRIWTHYSVRVADAVIVQSKALAERIIERIPSVQDHMVTIPHGPGYLDGPETGVTRMRAPSDTLEVAYVALYRSYKNFDVLLRAFKILEARGIPVRLHLTLDVVDDEGARRVISEARAMGVEDLIVNHGELQPERVSRLYRSAHVFVFPSVCESFGFPQVEAMAFGLPMLVADTQVNREICGDAASYFPANDEKRLAGLIEHLYRDRSEFTEASRRSRRRGRDFDWSTAAARTLEQLTCTE